MKVPPKRKGNTQTPSLTTPAPQPSMKVPPKRKGNYVGKDGRKTGTTLNESPSEKEGKSAPCKCTEPKSSPSMKVPPKRKGNFGAAHCVV